MDLRVDGEGGRVDGVVTLHDLALVVHQDEVAHPDVAEVHAEGVDPEVVGTLRIPRRDVAGDPLVEAEPREETERGRQTLLAVQPVVLDRVELRRQGEPRLRHLDTSTRGDATNRS